MPKIKSNIDVAISQAEKSNHEYYKHGAISILGNKIMTKGYNKSLVKDVIFNSLHAEMSVIQQLKRLRLNEKERKKINVVVIRVNKCGELKMSKPCQNCQNIMKDFGIKKCYFSNDLGKFEIMSFE